MADFVYPVRREEIIIFQALCTKDTQSMPELRFTTIGASGVPITSKSLHYGHAYFEGAGVDAHQNGGSFMYHYDWNAARLEQSGSASHYGFPRLFIEDHMRVLADLVFLNGYDEKMMAQDAKGGVHQCTSLYVRPLLYLPRATDIVLRNTSKDPFQLAVMAFPQIPYHGNRDCSKGMAVLFVNSPRLLEEPQNKAAENYAAAMRRVQEMENLRERLLVEVPEHSEVWNRLNEVIRTNQHGNVTEGSAENVAIVIGNTLFTPPIESGALPGFTMQLLELIALERGMKVERRDFTQKEIRKCDLMMITGNAAGLVKVTTGVTHHEPTGEIGIFEIGNKKGSALFDQLNADYALMRQNAFGKGYMMGCYAQDIVSESERNELRERGAELHRKITKEAFALEKRHRAGIKAGERWGVTFSEPATLLGRVDQGHFSRLPDGRRLSSFNLQPPVRRLSVRMG